jgi:hypothetical protein
MSEVYHTFVSSSSAAPMVTFNKRWDHVASLLRVKFIMRGDDHLNALLDDARQYLLTAYMTDPELLQISSDDEWVEIALQGVLRINEQQPLFNHQFELIEKRLHAWARRHFPPEAAEDIVHDAFINLWEDYQQHRSEWDLRSESFWVSCGKLAMREANRERLTQTHHRVGSSRRGDKMDLVQHMFTESAFPLIDDDEEDEQNGVLDMLSQNDDIDIHGEETRKANLRLDLGKLLKTVQTHYRPAIFERCLLVLERLAEGYTAGEIRLELGWTKVTYESTMTFIRRMSTFAEDYQRAPNRCAKMSEAEIARIHGLRAAGCTQPAIARLVGRDTKTIWKVMQPTVSV